MAYSHGCDLWAASNMCYLLATWVAYCIFHMPHRHGTLPASVIWDLYCWDECISCLLSAACLEAYHEVYVGFLASDSEILVVFWLWQHTQFTGRRCVAYWESCDDCSVIITCTTGHLANWKSPPQWPMYCHDLQLLAWCVTSFLFHTLCEVMGFVVF